MKTLIEQIVDRLHQLPEPNVQEVLDFVEILVWYRGKSDAIQDTQSSASLTERGNISHETTAADVIGIGRSDN